MLALAWLNTEMYHKAAELLRTTRSASPIRRCNMHTAWRSSAAIEPQKPRAIFARLLAEHGDPPN